MRGVLDRWFATIVRYVGLGLFVYSLLIDKFHNPALFTAALAMMLLKNVTGSGSGE